ncbi:hypothetical protein NDA16_003549 [Ustilago loliicola]|nr:hypothetical protein NDA16_003549 [Ustilago loliicola]
MAAAKVASSKTSTSFLPNGAPTKKSPTKQQPKNVSTTANRIDASASASTSAAASSSASSGKYIESLTKYNAAFTSLLHLIPPQFYLTRDDADDLAEDGASSKYMKNKRKKAKSEIEAKERKDKLREAKKQRLDPDNFATVTDIQAERAAAKAARQAAEADSDLDMDVQGMVSDDDDDEDETRGAAGDTDDDMQDSDQEDLPSKPTSGVNGAAAASAAPAEPKPIQTEGERKASVEALRAKLHAKIAGLQRKRGHLDAIDDASDAGSSVISSKDELLEERRRQRIDARDKKKQKKMEAKAAAKAAAKAKKAGVDNAPNGQKVGKQLNVGTKAPALLVAEPGYGDKRNGASGSGASNIDVNGGSLNFNALNFQPVGAAGASLPESSAGSKKSKLALPSDPKAALQVLEARKKQEEARRAKLADKLGDAPDALNAKVSELEEQKQWDKALASATGVKIRDDEKLLKKAAKRKDKQKEKSGIAWNERKQAEVKQQADRQKKRQDNIAARKAAKGGKGKKGSSSTLSKSKTPSGKKPSFGKARPGFEGKKIGRSKK